MIYFLKIKINKKAKNDEKQVKNDKKGKKRGFFTIFYTLRNLTNRYVFVKFMLLIN